MCARWWWVAAVPVGACAVAGATADAVWYFVMLILIFTLLPAVLAFIWMWRALSPQAAESITEHTVTVSEGGVTVTPAFDDPWWHEHTFPADEIINIYFKPKEYIIELKSFEYKHIAIPVTAIEPGLRPLLEKIMQSFVPEMAQ